MSRPSLEVIRIIRNAARNLDASSQYQWGHMGACNCGFLAQEATGLNKSEIHRRAMMRHGDWSEQLNDYCLTSGLPMDSLISQLVAIGFDIDDLKNLERLADPDVIRSLPVAARDLHFNVKKDAVTYLKAWAAQLEDELLRDVSLPRLNDMVPAEA